MINIGLHIIKIKKHEKQKYKRGIEVTETKSAKGVYIGYVSDKPLEMIL
jgi:hypothetical protein